MSSPRLRVRDVIITLCCDACFDDSGSGRIREFIGTKTTRTLNGSSEANEPRGPLIKKAIDHLPSLGDVSTQNQQSDAVSDEEPALVPATVVWLRLSKQYLKEYIERTVDRKKPVHDYILGTTITGESHTTGTTRLVLYPNDNQALGEVEFVGQVHAQTTGRNGPATLSYLSDSTFQASKRLTISESGLSASPAIADAPTRLTATDLHTNLPRLRGIIAERIAWGRVASTRSQADAIASAHTAEDIRQDLDRKVNESVAAIQMRLQTQLAKLRYDGEGKPIVMRSRSTPDFVEVAMHGHSAEGR